MDKVIKEKNIEIISRQRFVKIAPDKIRLAAGLIKNKNLDQAMDILEFSNLAAATPLLLNLKQALSQAKDKDIPTENLRVEIIKVDEGPKLKRRRILHQGRSTAILKRMAHITVVLKEQRKSEIQNSKSQTAKKQRGDKQNV